MTEETETMETAEVVDKGIKEFTYTQAINFSKARVTATKAYQNRHDKYWKVINGYLMRREPIVPKELIEEFMQIDQKYPLNLDFSKDNKIVCEKCKS